MSGCIAAINAGSSSVKFAKCQASNSADIMFGGQIKGIGVAPRLKVRTASGHVLEERTRSAESFNHDVATREILATGASLISGIPVVGIGHRRCPRWY
jgi:acetate kinase